jgi:low temperature requirement protein LtrA
MSRPVVSPHDQSATFVELFFDLVFVFCVTQVVGLLHHDLSWAGTGRAVLVFWLVWWGWTQLTWALNAADTEHPLVEFGTLLATAVAFFMAVAIPEAFAGGGLRFAVPYVLVRAIGLGIYAWVTSADPSQKAAVLTFALVSTGGMAAALIGGLAGGDTQLYLWGLMIFLDLVAATVGAQSEHWNIHPRHFAERHGLIVIIALGESLIVAAGGLAGVELGGRVVGVAVLAVLTSCALWWTYFPVAKPRLEAALESVSGSDQSRMARDVFSLFHFPMLCGVVAFAVALEEAIAHPADPLGPAGRLALGAGPLLFVGGMAAAMWRATCGRLAPRVGLSVLTAGAVFLLAGLPPLASIGTVFVGAAAIAIVEEGKAQRLNVR